MSLFVLDTDTLSLYQRGHPQIGQHVAAHPLSELAITVIAVEEQLSGWYALLRAAKRRDQIAQVYERLANTVPSLARFPILGFPEPAILRFEQLVTQKLNIGKMDLRVAAIVLEHGAILVTRNQRDFRRVPGLLLQDWSV